ncbi:hypothetical protein [Aureibacillus halotolerans]|uniref:Uncharacterized protein n=1 Tax=Aureibacillus halotolerans TaxID=1508390 RepID=A0A4R6TSA9_9BACI|nr:hypothetical protein [Aureibacillus halotolerans]TDQ33740.1 hypothetical protein EV213_1296 [Aureibacillus halotolerans]
MLEKVKVSEKSGEVPGNEKKVPGIGSRVSGNHGEVPEIRKSARIKRSSARK